MSAIISECGKYRYRLERTVAMEGPVYAFFGVNPSTADAELDDATVRKWTGFVKRWGGSRFIVGNVFAYRATDVRELAIAPGHAIGPENIRHLREIAAAADICVPCWGSRAKLPQELHPSLKHMERELRATGKPLAHFGLTASGDPKHPLMLGYDTPLIDWALERT
ncbi:MAG: DUF1643 domain-containing protein [Pseudomonadota bacterium]